MFTNSILVLFFVITLIIKVTNAEVKTQFPPNEHRCVWASNKLRKNGDGTTDTSCVGCDPTKPECPVGCQDLIDTLYWSCAGVTLPDGYYFDPNNNMEGSWNSNLGAMKINVERCGCNNAFKGATINVTVLLLSLIVAVYLYLQ